MPYIPTFIGLACLPIICHPIDKFTNYLLDINEEI